jgi:small-conductance mechanosensitive channel
MTNWLRNIELDKWYNAFEIWFQKHVLSLENLFQVVILGLTLFLGILAGRPLARFLKNRLSEKMSFHVLVKSFFSHFLKTLPFLLGALLLWIATFIFERSGYTAFLMSLVLNLTVAWILVQLAASVILDRYWARFVTIVVWFFAALNIVGLFEPVISFLGDTGFSIGQTQLTMLSVLQAIILLVVLLKAVSWVRGHFDQRLTEVPGINSSTRLMLSKVTHVFLVVLASIVVLNTVGIDFSSLAIFSGAIGVGVGFGLQKVVSNYISGLILLSDKSIKPGDVIELGDAFGWVRFMGGRYVSVVTRDEKEYLIPNEDLITQQVINWSYSTKIIRQTVKFGVSYKSNPHRVIELVLEKVKGTQRVLDDPKPACLITGFGDSSLDFEFRYWIKDPINGTTNISSIILLKIWDALKEEGIEIPFPQRDVHIKS